MALSIETEEAVGLARELSRLTGETMTDAITRALRERLERVRAERAAQGDYVARVQAFVRKQVHLFDRRPVTDEEWDEACGDVYRGNPRARRSRTMWSTKTRTRGASRRLVG